MHQPRRIKVVYLIGHLGLGGSEHQLFLLLSHLDKTQFEFHVIVFNPSSNYVFDHALKEMGIRVWNIPPACTSISQRFRYVYGLLRNLNADIVHSWTFHDNPYAGLVGALAGIPVRYGSLRNSLSLEGTSNLDPVLRFIALYSVSEVFVNATTIAAELRQRNFPEKRIRLLPNCVDVDAFSAAAPADLSELGIQNDQRVVGMVANLRRVKGHLLFIEAMAEVLREFDNVTGLIIGQPVPSEPDYPEMIREAIRETGFENRIIMTGFRNDVPSLMKCMEVYCLASETEGMPNVVLEAMAAKRPVVATRVGGIVDIVHHEETGLLASPGDAATITHHIVSLLKDPSLEDRISQNGFRIALQHDCSHLVTSLANSYLEAASD